MPMTFEAAFDRLHRDMRTVLHDASLHFDGAVEELARQRLLRFDEESFLDCARSLRNFLSHSHDLVARGLVTVNIETSVSERLIAIADRLARRVPASRYMLPWTKVKSAPLDGLAEPLMAEMLSIGLRHIPIISNGRVVGIFNETTVFRALASERLEAIKPETRLRDIMDATLPENAGIVFAEKGISFLELRERLTEINMRGTEPFIVIFTENGDPEQLPIGIVEIRSLPNHT